MIPDGGQTRESSLDECLILNAFSVVLVVAQRIQQIALVLTHLHFNLVLEALFITVYDFELLDRLLHCWLLAKVLAGVFD